MAYITPLVVLLSIFSSTRASYKCATPKDFEAENSLLKTAAFYKQNLPLHLFLFENAKTVGQGAYGEVRIVSEVEPKLVIKKMVEKKVGDFSSMIREIEVLKKICGQEPKATSNKISDCKSDLIAGFRGCVEYGKEVYIFQDPMLADLSNPEVLMVYRELSGGRKAQFMVDIINKFQKLHDMSIIHRDIKVGNIMLKTNDFSDIRIVDFGLSRYVDEIGSGGTPFFISPERYQNQKATVEGDIYSLAMTFAILEEEYEIYANEEFKKCKSAPPGTRCEMQYRNGLSKAFSKETKTDFLFGVFLTATEIDPAKRYHKMSDFADAITARAKDLPEFGSNPQSKVDLVWNYIKKVFDKKEDQVLNIQPLNAYDKLKAIPII